MGLTESAGRKQAAVAPPARRPSAGWTLALTSLATFMVALDALVVITALPSIQHDLHASVSTLQWTINAYGIAWASGIVTAAALGDIFGRKRVFLSGVALFTLASAVCAIAPTMGVLIAARAVQGLGAAVILPLSLTIIGGVFPPEKRGMMIGIWGGIGGLAIALGPLIGGALTQSLSWHWVFWVNAPIGILVGLFSAARIVETRGPGKKLDLPGVALVTIGAASLIFALVRSGEAGWGSGTVLGGILVGIVFLVGFVMWERRAPEPILPLRLFKNLPFTSANVTSFSMTAALLAASVYLTQYFQLVRGDSPFGAGVRLLPMMAMPLIAAPLAGAISDKIGQRTLIVTGLLGEGVGLLWFMLVADTTVSYGSLVVPMVLIGFGLGMALATTPTAALSSVPPPEMGKASGANSTLTRFGGAFGVAITTAVFSANGSLGSPATVLPGVRAAILVAGIFAVLGALTGLGIRGRRPAAPPPPPAPARVAKAATAAEN
jgi:EmrB/QacA subfamily drug resistance transporter